MSVVNGFLGLRHYKRGIECSPAIPNAWDSFSCNIAYKNALMRVTVSKDESVFTLVRGERISFKVNGKAIVLDKDNKTYQEAGTAII